MSVPDTDSVPHVSVSQSNVTISDVMSEPPQGTAPSSQPWKKYEVVSTVADAPATMFPNMTVQIPTRMLYINGFKLLRQAFDDALRSDDRETHAYESLVPALLPGVLMTPVSSILEACNAEYANPEPLLRRAARGATFRCGREVIFGLGLNNLADYCEERVPRDVANSKLARNALGSVAP